MKKLSDELPRSAFDMQIGETHPLLNPQAASSGSAGASDGMVHLLQHYGEELIQQIYAEDLGNTRNILSKLEAMANLIASEELPTETMEAIQEYLTKERWENLQNGPYWFTNLDGRKFKLWRLH